jgi:hypothetical protein|tara:strand:- start:101 stop:307 length:207 start_codon:yes stop_codon:yes gene_type:complete
MKSIVMSKPNLQSILKGLRVSGIEVTKIGESGYKGEHKGELVLKALKGRNGYLVRYGEINGHDLIVTG